MSNVNLSTTPPNPPNPPSGASPASGFSFTFGAKLNSAPEDALADIPAAPLMPACK